MSQCMCLIGPLTPNNRSLYPITTDNDFGEPTGAILGGLRACFILPAGGLGGIDECLRAVGRSIKGRRVIDSICVEVLSQHQVALTHRMRSLLMHRVLRCIEVLAPAYASV
jgi:hypothetical protein